MCVYINLVNKACTWCLLSYATNMIWLVLLVIFGVKDDDVMDVSLAIPGVAVPATAETVVRLDVVRDVVV